MRRIISRLLVASLLLIGGVSLTGCIVAPPRHAHHGHYDGHGHSPSHHDRNRGHRHHH